MSRAGYVLVGGRSSRMGRDKALLPFRGGSLVEFVARTVAGTVGSAVLVGPPDLYSGFPYPVIPDRYPGEGPLGGILTALGHSSEDWNLIVACDMPGLSTDFLGRIMEAAGQSAADALLPIGPSGIAEPLCAVYRRRALARLEAAFEGGQRKITAALAALQVETLTIPEVTHFNNVNTPEDWAAYGRE